MSKEVLLLLWLGLLLINSTCAKITIVKGERMDWSRGEGEKATTGWTGRGWDMMWGNLEWITHEVMWRITTLLSVAGRVLKGFRGVE